ncbi:uncharacterized protein LOC127852143 isoform X2 [Dreissena polymorpha]|uniref:uncharacterized protein LOC127852143 isoform X2 n=1 Tax=Dreissena polymorpha TaxID=45954 RepID=UPI00226406C0|nr:uncharacterized protein LOC127852143 isoform X2 [Dreissena polymorpha]
MFNKKLFGLVILNVQWIVHCDEVCRGLSYKYCGDGTYCCNNDRSCCMAVGRIIEIVSGVVGFIAFCVVLLGCCMRQCRSRAAQGQVIGQPQQGQIQTENYPPPSIGETQYGMQTGYPPPPAYGQTQSGLQAPYPAYSPGLEAHAYINHTVPDTTTEQK